jgi:thiol-disulfide isomerase/thioredoxin
MPAMRQPEFSAKIPLALLFVVLLTLAASGQAPKTGSKSEPHGPTRSSAPDFALQSLYGETVRLSDLRDKVVLLYFWATWCGPCKIEMPRFVDLQNQYGPQGLQIVAVVLDEDATEAEVAGFADSVRANYPILIGNQKVADAYGGLPVLPESFLIARDGKIVDKTIGLKDEAEIEDGIKKALDPVPTSCPPSSGSTPAPQPHR